ncbi:hypothetical protein CAI21_11210 [Alkalilimnicola ehrlichii]|uniref:HTH araC/xylS-type domain-containing protein n=1 Tax=Alkalilimnicola ehrlichii TaxID=351052 RepID=A0A3E0X0D8_9GAMM|nr:helix-turn-helix transcriptional regulator [Alkalilimnicola ehrlichii]RFA29010.1 hypothetical protein CAI21_11210 [Alkalilimnicola ehrlichii]RFA38645.1 hypothetical protein CAL65_04760 [Alkalilimnicola ehrlichii]
MLNLNRGNDEPRGRALSGEQVKLSGETFGSGYEISGSRPESSIFSGTLRAAKLRDGLLVHCADLCDLADTKIELLLHPVLSIELILRSEADIFFDNRPLKLRGTLSNGKENPRGVLISLTDPVRFRRQARAGNRERKVSILLSKSWLAQDSHNLLTDSELGRLYRRRLTIAEWQPSPRAIALAGQMLQPAALTPLLERMYLESRAIELAAEALSQLGRQPVQMPTRLKPRDYRRMLSLREYLDSGEAASASLPKLAAQVNVSVNTLQRHFKAAFGLTVFDYLREQNLQRARAALEQGGVSVAEAAEIAGYNSAANFATAYKRRFSIAPKESRARL